MTPEQQARQQIDAQLAACGWAIQDYAQYNPAAAHGIALREVPLKSGKCDYLLQFVEAGVLDAARFQTILARHGLVAVWQKFERQFLRDEP